MPDTSPETAPEPAADNPQAAKPPRSRQIRGLPVLEKLAGHYPHLFGNRFMPLKRGIFQDILTAHPEAFSKEDLKEALAFHTRSTRYLSSVAAGHQRHDLQGAAVEAMAPEHVHHALLEVYRRRVGRTKGAEDASPANAELKEKLIERIAQAFGTSGLSREAYGELMRGRDEAANALLDEALALAAERTAKDEALLRAFEASGQKTVQAFAEMYGMDVRAATQSLTRARRSAS